MKKSIFVMLVLVTLLGCKTEPPEPPAPPETSELNGATYELEWEDNFEKNRIVSTCFDGSKHSTGWWIYQQDWGAARANSEYKIWASKFDDNVVLKDGKLKLTVRTDHDAKICSGGEVFSYELFQLKDSMWEIRFKIPKTTDGDWFVFNIQPRSKKGDFPPYYVTDKVWTQEFTAIETEPRRGRYRGSEYLWNEEHEQDPNYVDSSAGRYTGEWGYPWSCVEMTDDFYDVWHTLKYVWDKNEIIGYMDGEEVYRKPKCAELKQADDDDLYGAFYLAVDVIGECDGPVNLDMPTHSCYIDYVKVWRKIKK